MNSFSVMATEFAARIAEVKGLFVSRADGTPDLALSVLNDEQ